jgi:hypothetical protein
MGRSPTFERLEAGQVLDGRAILAMSCSSCWTVCCRLRWMERRWRRSLQVQCSANWRYYVEAAGRRHFGPPPRVA